MKHLQRQNIVVRGIVQGVGFRPFVYREAIKENLKGFVANTSLGVEIQVEGDSAAIERFIERVQTSHPVLAKITDMHASEIPLSGSSDFTICSSRDEDGRSTLISPDISVCDECISELFDPGDRRYKYSFINCTNCGPRYTIIRDIPYDRSETTMSSFKMCPDCQKEYDDPSNRRFHAQPNACPVCGPMVWLTNTKGNRIDTRDPIRKTIGMLKKGNVVAVKGLGGFHLACDATNEKAVLKLRERKGREEKPLAVMASDIAVIDTFAEIGPHERDLLISPRRPIVLLRKKEPNPIAESVAPGNTNFGTMLPYTPLHYLLLAEGLKVLVMTSGNISEEPIAKENDEAVQRLGDIADIFLMHNRQIYLRSDDSVTRVVADLHRQVRRSRGYVPVPIFLRKPVPSILAVGGELKNTICITRGDQAFLSQHIGDLENLETLNFFEECVHHLCRILEIKPEIVACDLHPDYLSTQWAMEQKDIKIIGVQHHHAHIAACLAENGREEKVIGLALDGTGYGSDGTIWGGEVLIADLSSFERVGHFQYRSMPGGDKAIREPWRMGISYLHEYFLNQFGNQGNTDDFIDWIGDIHLMEAVGKEQIRTVVGMIRQGLNTPVTSSLGRLFDGVAAIAGLRLSVVFEGQAAMELEMAMKDNSEPSATGERYLFEITEKEGVLLFLPDPVIDQLIQDVMNGKSLDMISRKFHAGVVQLLRLVCKKVRDRTGLCCVVLSGGCFQNYYLLTHLIKGLKGDGFNVLTHSQIPANDGGLSLGQAVVAAQSVLS